MAAGIDRRKVLAWSLWDWGSASWNAVITSFVFGPYIVRGVVGEARPLGLSANAWLGISGVIGGLVVLAIAPITGQRSDAGGKRKRNLAIWTALTVAVMLGLFGVKNEPSYMWFALVLLAAGGIFAEFAGVSYNAMLPQVSTPDTVGRISGFGWSMGYFGGIVLLLICYVGFIAPGAHWFGVTSEGGLNIRTVAVFSAAWFALFAVPLFFAVPEKPPGPPQRRVSFFQSYRLLIADVRSLYRRDRNAVRFLIASALYRDGLAAVFSYGAILAVSVYGLTQDNVLDLRHRGQCRRRPRGTRTRPGRGPDRAEEGDHDLPGRAAGDLGHPAVLLRPDHVLDLRPGADPVGGTGSGELTGLPRPGCAGRAGG